MFPLEKLKKLSKFETQEDALKFDEMVGELVQSKDPNVLDKLFDLFDDETEHPEVMYSLVHAIESYEDEIYIQHLLTNSPKLFKNSQHWCEVLWFRILNSDNCLNVLKKNLCLVPKHELLIIFEALKQESPHHSDLVKKLWAERESLNNS